ncbi:MAG: ferredoxin reductase [Aeromicrobium sp.]|uniref:ferredoxin reductase n=1 Tax=Aeromicrobium sp. TaxID=1871063 RepID=UPI0039E3DC86
MTLTQRVLESRVLAALTSPHGVDRYLEQIHPMWAATEVRARVTDIVRETDGEHPVATLTLQPTRTWRGHRSGQYVQVGVEVEAGRRVTRCFSISSAASLPGEPFTITVRSHAEGVVSKHLVNDARVGEIIHLSQAEGDFTVHESAATPTNNHLLMISGGSGITPVMSHIRTLLRDGYDGHANRKVTFLHYARSREDQIFAEELDRIAAEDNGITVHLRYGAHLFDADELRKMVGDYTDIDTWACGPGGLIELVQEAYGDSPRLRVEFFKPPAFATDGDAEGTIVFAKSGTSAENSGANLLEQAEEAGLAPQFGCRMGICFSCTVVKTEGTVRNVLTGETSSLPDEEVRVCVSAPVGNCSIDL